MTRQIGKAKQKAEVQPEDWQKLQNDVEIIKNRVSSLDRLAVLQNRDALEAYLRDLVGDSAVRAAVLHLTKEPVSAGDLADKLGVDSTNLAKYTKPFTGQIGILAELKQGASKIYLRDEKLDMINYDNLEPFKSLIAKWRSGRPKNG